MKFGERLADGGFKESLSLRRAWIEIDKIRTDRIRPIVALLTESVD